MTTKKYVEPPITPNSHLGQLAALQEVDEETLNDFEKVILKSLFSARAMKVFRNIHISEMAAAGYTAEQIGLAFAARDSELHPLIIGLTGEKAAHEFLATIKEAVAAYTNLSDEDWAGVYIKNRQRLLQETLSSLARVEPSQHKALLELVDKLQQDIAESHGGLFRRAGKRSSTKRSAAAQEAPEKEPLEEAEDPKVDWKVKEGEFEDDDSEDQLSPTEQQRPAVHDVHH